MERSLRTTSRAISWSPSGHDGGNSTSGSSASGSRLRHNRLSSNGIVGIYAAIALAITLGPLPAVAASESPADEVAQTKAVPVSSIDASGIEIVTEITQARPINEAQAQALSDAFELAEANPDDVGYPWIDPASGMVELSAASEKGIGLLEQSRASISEPSRVRDVKFSFGKLEAIKHEITTLRAAGVLDADLIYQTTPDHLNNRVVVTISAPSAVLFAELAKRYGTDAIAVLVDPTNRGAGSANRQSDISPFYGGAFIITPLHSCSDSFAWTVSTTGDTMLTAAHCIPFGGAVTSNPATTPMGTVTSGPRRTGAPPSGRCITVAKPSTAATSL